MDNFKYIHIGDLIKERVSDLNIEKSRICNFLHCTETEIEQMYKSEEISTRILLGWSKLLKYDFFRIYSHHLILYSPPSGNNPTVIKKKKSKNLPEFRKNIYTTEIIYFILELIATGKKSKKEIMEEYRIPKTTLYKWISKYQNNK